MANVLPHNAPQGFDWVTRLKSWDLDGSVLRLTVDTAAGAQASLTFQALTPAIWRFTFVPPDAEPDPPTPIVVADKTPGVSLYVELTTTGIVVRGPALALAIDRDPWMIRWLDADGRDIARENPSDIDGLGRPFVLPLGYVRGADGVTAVTESLHLRPDEHLFGLGEKFTPLDKVQQRIVTWTQDAFGSTSERSHKNIPFLISTRGYGLLLDTGTRVTWDLGNVSCQSYTMTLDAPALDGYLIYGPTPAEILGHYTALTGRAPLPPKWSFGLWMSGAGTYRDRAAMEALVAGLDEHDIPADVIHVDTWWLRWRQYCDFRWDEEAFPDVKGFTDALHAAGYHLTVWEHAYISVESDLYAVGEREGYFLKRPDGSVYVIDYGLSLAPRPDGIVRVATPETSWNAPVAIIDMSNPDAVRWFQDLHRPAIASGIDAFKTDFGEDIPEDAVFFNGQTGRTMHNLYPLLYNQAVTDVVRQERGYGLVWARSGTAGNQRFPVCWSGDPAADFDSLACTVRGGLSIGLSGVPFWSHDIGGYRGMPSPRLFVRWAQFGLMSSHSRMHGDSPREPWYFGPEATEIIRRYVKLRYALFPYLYSLAHEAHRTGLPVIRAMPLAFPGDPSAVGQDLQYMLGPSLLVAPVVDDSDARAVYLPAGTWIDYWTGQAIEGPAHIVVKAPLDTLPLFVRGGAAIPMMPPASRIPAGRIDPLIVAVYPHGSSSYTLLEDEGETALRYEEHDGTRIFTLHGDQPRAVIVRPVGFGPLSDVRVVVNGQPVEVDLHLHPDGIEIHLDGVREAEIRL
jgi:alpha-D-xyloside xylohydrolase